MYDTSPTYAEDPQEKLDRNRSITDAWALGLFAAMVVGILWASIHGFMGGNPARLYKGVNFQGKVCGVDAGLTDRPFVFFPLDAESPTVNIQKGLCVARCFTQADAENGVTVKVPWAVEGAEADVSTGTTATPVYATSLVADAYCIPEKGSEQTPVLEQLSSAFTQLQMGIGSLSQSWFILVVAFVWSLGLSFCFVYFLSVGPEWIFHLFFGLTELFLVVLGVGGVVAGTTDLLNPLKFSSMTSVADFWFILLGSVILAFATVLGLIYMCYISKISRALKLVDMAGDVVMDNGSLWFWPLISSATAFIWIVYWLAALLYIASSGTVTGNPTSVGGFVKRMEYDTGTTICLVWWLIAFFWVLEIIHAASCFAVSYAGALWYSAHEMAQPGEEGTSRDSGPCPAVFGALSGFFHLGSFTLGSLFIMVFRIPRMLFFWASERHEKTGEARDYEQADACCGCCTGCCSYLLDQFNDLAWCDMVLRSEDFLDSCSSALETVCGASRKLSLTALSGVTNTLATIGVLFVAAGTTVPAFLLVTSVPAFTEQDSSYYVSSPVVICVLIFLMSLVVGSMSMQLVDQLADAMLYFVASDYNEGRRHKGHPQLERLMQETDLEMQSVGQNVYTEEE
uniref:Choline transporter-like protein n=1 Tax=Chromera velia CCMP2878 TaxID=1169474 RepID=A0A0G4I7C8_9ALVE|mmetsp:Transcript_33791/g.66909  ORF Transcript_33791/g.66909 Transcript_33791/m.66909 type:complete len:625 (-) Transcript_33791:1250-3124(-)|eukprot:Cvel_11635.t1-p1 / transcript=Cvel_11635.t1 / gene=Cvel_11635 / organism=Chromera_velia_CCMP2878 / gene_product=CTL-like protein 1, putative / transcript_product=CTL-like protein 1, putative / location=Cvel_scaffold737:2351-9104(+) / protein_length=624 / sequence_SO=supercontig / SO=protein_coding / is_pseudo=false